MTRISDEGSNLRGLARRWSKNKSIKPGVYNCLMTIADRIDTEMVKLPKDRDGAPIHVGDTVYGEDGMSYKVVSISFGRWPGGVTVNAVNGFSKWRDLIPGKMTHISPDSWKRIADELEEWSEDNRINGDGEVFDRARQFSERIRKLAESGD